MISAKPFAQQFVQALSSTEVTVKSTNWHTLSCKHVLLRLFVLTLTLAYVHVDDVVDVVNGVV